MTSVSTAQEFVDQHLTTNLVLTEVLRERAAQDARWGEQNHPDIDHPSGYGPLAARADYYRVANDASAAGIGPVLDWAGILLEEVYEAVSEQDVAKLRAELIQVAAVAVCWVEAIDRRVG